MADAETTGSITETVNRIIPFSTDDAVQSRYSLFLFCWRSVDPDHGGAMGQLAIVLGEVATIQAPRRKARRFDLRGSDEKTA